MGDSLSYLDNLLSNYSDMTWKLLVFKGKLVAEERWSLTRGGSSTALTFTEK